MKVMRSETEEQQIRAMLYEKSSFKNVFKKNWTQIVMKDLRYRLYGKIPRNFLVNIGGGIGTPSGVFKSSLGLQIALTLDPLFNLKARVAFSVNDLLDKVSTNTEIYMTLAEFTRFAKNYKGTYEVYEADKEIFNTENELCTRLILLTKQIFFLDEQTRSLKTGGLVRLQNLIDTCRQRQICFITCGVESYELTFATYDLLRVQESHDNYLPKKQVRYGVYDRKRDLYYGYFLWNIVPLTDVAWKRFWGEYSKMKTQFQRIAIQQQTSAMDYENYAEQVMELEDYEKCFKETKEGKKRFLASLCKALILKKYPDLTNQERDTILSEIKMKL